jgi:hypothetical protein
MIAFQRTGESLDFDSMTYKKERKAQTGAPQNQRDRIENCRGDIQGRNFVKALSRRWNANVQ